MAGMAFDPPTSSSLRLPQVSGLLLLLAPLTFLAACAEDDAGEATGPVGQPGADAALPDAAGQPPVYTLDSGVPSNPGGRDAGMIDITIPGLDAGGSRDSGVIDIPLPTVSVACGGSPCEAKNGVVCCETWDKNTGFSKASCLPSAMCTANHSSSGASNRSVTSVCDDGADCSGGQVCCYVRIPSSSFGSSQPLCDGFLSTCGDISAIVGPGASRVCLDVASCNSANPPSFGTGVISCSTDADCKSIANTTCQPEQADAEPKPVGTVASTAGARAYAKVCR